MVHIAEEIDPSVCLISQDCKCLGGVEARSVVSSIKNALLQAARAHTSLTNWLAYGKPAEEVGE